MDKKTLQNYRAMDLELQQLEELIELIEERIYEAKTTHLTLTPKGGGFAGDAILSDLAELESLRDLYNHKWDAFIDAKKAITK